MMNETKQRALRVGVAGPVGSGKTALVQRLSEVLSTRYSVAVVTNDIYTREDAEFLLHKGILEPGRISGVETGGCPHAAIRDDASMNLEAILKLQEQLPDLDLILLESGGNNLAAAFSPELVDLWCYVIDVSAGDKIPRKGGPGIMRSDLLIINKIDLAPLVGASLEVMARDARRMRNEKPFLFTNLKDCSGLDRVVDWVELALGNAQSLPPMVWDGRIEYSGPAEYLTHGYLHSHSYNGRLQALLPPRYRNGTTSEGAPVSAAPMEAADLIFREDGAVAWDEIWSDFCDLALAGGPSHRGTLLEPVAPEDVAAQLDSYAAVLAELERGIGMVSDLSVLESATPGWIGVVCPGEEAALWMLRAIVVENICVRREGNVLYLPAGPRFSVHGEIKGIITVIAKVYHYYTEHMAQALGE